jgi:hypothetical protein
MRANIAGVSWTLEVQPHFQGGNNVKAGLGVCFALSRNYVGAYRGAAIMRKKMHATVF